MLNNRAVIDRIVEIIDEVDNGVYSHFAKRIGQGPSTLRSILSGNNLPNTTTLINICESIGVSADWLLFGIAPKYRHKRDIHELPEHTLTIVTTPEEAQQWEDLEDPRHFKVVPILDSIAAGPARIVDTKDISGHAVIYTDWLSNGHHVCFRVVGRSMEPVLSEGDLIGVNLSRRDPEELQNSIVAAFVDEGVTVKRLRYIKEGAGRIILIPQNIEEHDPREFPLSEAESLIVGLVEWCWRKL